MGWPVTDGAFKKMLLSDDIKPAQSTDAPAIYSLLCEAFGSSYLKYTIYQTPKSVLYLRNQIELARFQHSPSVIKMWEGQKLLGFYFAVRRCDEYFLNYIATSIRARGRGVGRSLLAHFESAAAEKGCSATGLEVFESNRDTVAWYRREGYRQRSSRYLARFELSAFRNGQGPDLIFNSEELERALSQEKAQGFSSISCPFAGGSVTLGIIGGDVCNLLKAKGSTAEIANAVARSGLGYRRWLLITTTEPIGDISGLESIETSLYMTRPISGQSL